MLDEYARPPAWHSPSSSPAPSSASRTASRSSQGPNSSHPGWLLQLGLMTSVLYLLMSYPLSLVARRLERRFPRVAV